MSSTFIKQISKLLAPRYSRLMVFGFCLVFFISVSPDNSQVSRSDFVAMIAKNQPDHPFLPKNHADLSKEELFVKTSRILKIRGFKVLSDKDPKGAISDQEFVRLTYALSGEPPGRSLFDQKLFLKKHGVVQSADVGIATGTEGKILQFHEGETSSNDVKLASPVFMNDRIKTKSDSEASFTFDDKSSLTLGENSNVSIKKHIYDPDKDLRQTVVNVALGTVRFVVTKGKAKGSSFKVVTPTAVAGVRGTEFIVTVDKVGKTSFIGISGSIETAPLLANGKMGKKSIVAKGQIQEISKGVLTAAVKTNNGNAFGKNKDKSNNGKGKNKDKGNKGKGKGKNKDKGNKGENKADKGKGSKDGKGKTKLADKGINLKKAEKTTQNTFLKKEEVQKPRIKTASLSSQIKSPSFKVKPVKDNVFTGSGSTTGKGGKEIKSPTINIQDTVKTTVRQVARKAAKKVALQTAQNQTQSTAREKNLQIAKSNAQNQAQTQNNGNQGNQGVNAGGNAGGNGGGNAGGNGGGNAGGKKK